MYELKTILEKDKNMNRYTPEECKRLLPYIDAGLIKAHAEGLLTLNNQRMGWRAMSFTHPVTDYGVMKLTPKIDREKVAGADWVVHMSWSDAWYAGVGRAPTFDNRGALSAWPPESPTSTGPSWGLLPAFLTIGWEHHGLPDRDTLVLLGDGAQEL